MLISNTGGNTPPEPELPAKPASLSERFFSLDVLRGIAVLSALFISVWVFGGFSDQQKNKLLLESKGFDYRLYGSMELLFAGKMRGLIALVFGASMVYFLSREASPGRQPNGDVFIKRQVWLMVFGLVNALLLLWPMDILLHLGIAGIFLFPFFRLGIRSMAIAAFLITLIYSGKYFWNYSDDNRMYSKYKAAVALEKKYEKDSIAKAEKGITAKKDTLTKFEAGDKKAWEGKLAAMKPDIKKDDDKIKKMRSGYYAKIWNQRLNETQWHQAQWTYQFGIWDLCGMIFLGMLLYKMGFFNHSFSTGRYVLIALTGIAGGLIMGWFRLHFQQLALQDYEKFINSYSVPYNILFPFERACAALGYAALLMACIRLPFLKLIWKGFANAGKMALTNYLLQTIICTIFFYGYGMGYYARLTQWQLYFFVLEVAMVQVIFSTVWLKYYNYGPAEWLLRRLSGGKWMNAPFKKPSATEPSIPVLS